MVPLHYYLIFSVLLFSVGLAGVLCRRNAIIVLVGVELMLNAANLNFIAFWRYSAHPEAMTGVLFALFSIGIAAAEAAVGLAILVTFFRNRGDIAVDDASMMKG